MALSERIAQFDLRELTPAWPGRRILGDLCALASGHWARSWDSIALGLRFR